MQRGLIFEVGKGEVGGDLFQKCATWVDLEERGKGDMEEEMGGSCYKERGKGITKKSY